MALRVTSESVDAHGMWQRHPRRSCFVPAPLFKVKTLRKLWILFLVSDAIRLGRFQMAVPFLATVALQGISEGDNRIGYV